MPNTFIKIQTVTVGSGGAANIEFTSIPQTYTDLKLVLSLRDTRSAVANATFITLNGSTSNFTSRVLSGNGSAASSFTSVARFAGTNNSNTSTASVFNSTEIYFPNYTSANFKSFSVDSVTENNATEAYARLSANLWSDTAAITSIKVEPDTGEGGSFMQYSTATLYGIKSS